jgi:uncharacterized protein YutE (UPF0331/DUF86 family)
MTSERNAWEINVLRNLEKGFEARGMKFYINPPREVVPEFLGDFRPDAIAQGPEGGVVIEVKDRRSPKSDRQVAEIAKRVSSQKGWEFRAFYVNPPVDAMPSIAKPTTQQLRAAFEEVEALTKGGHHTAAFLAAWAALESLARLTEVGGEASVQRGFSPLQAIQMLAEEGYLENGDADNLRKMVNLRNAVAHGDLSARVSKLQLEHLLTQLRAIAANLQAA